MKVETTLSKAKWWARVACQMRETMECARTAHDDELLDQACMVYGAAKRHLWEYLDQLTPRQRRLFDAGVVKLLHLHRLASI
jgi:hypothetical protein